MQIDNESPPVASKMQGITEADRAMHHFYTTGLHLDYDEMKQWLDSWTTDNPQPLPPCHI